MCTRLKYLHNVFVLVRVELWGLSKSSCPMTCLALHLHTPLERKSSPQLGAHVKASDQGPQRCDVHIRSEQAV